MSPSVMRPLLLAGLILAGWITPILGTTYYVSHTGSNTPPYTSWATAADSIGTVFALAQPYDTVRVGPGVYSDQSLVMKDGMVFLGSGMDSTIVQLKSSTILVSCGDSVVVEGFYFRGNYPSVVFERLFRCYSVDTVFFIRNNKFSDSEYGIEMNSFAIPPVDATEIKYNLVETCVNDINIEARNPLIQGNITRNCSWFGIGSGAGFPKVIDNIALPSPVQGNAQIVVGTDLGAKEVRNNIAIGGGMDAFNKARGIAVTGSVRLENNTSAFNKGDGLNFLGGTFVFVQNNVSTGNKGAGLSSTDDSSSIPNLSIRFNDLWKNGSPPLPGRNSWDTIPFEGKLSKDPMFVDSLDVHLQFGSPCIDAGAPEIKDPDSSRSDIGAYGGLFGTTYVYQDLPPKAPDSLQGFFEDSLIRLTWAANTESDLGNYFLYRDTFSIVSANPALLLAQIPAFSLQYLDTQIIGGKTYYYRLEAVDTTNHKSSLSNEVFLVATGVGDEPQNRPRSFELFQNYPNPFNASTQIRFRLPPEGSHVARIEVFNSLGQKIKTLLNENLAGGNYVVFWDGRDENGNSVSSGIYFAALRWNDQRKTIAMVLLK